MKNYKNHNRFQSIDFMFDKAPCYTTQRSRTTFASASIDIKWIPKRMTPFLQPADQSWMRPIKLANGRKWNNWLRTATKAHTPAGNMKSIIDSSEDDNEDANELSDLLYIYFALFNT